MPDLVHQLVGTVRSAVNMAYAALGVSAVNAEKIAELEKRLRAIELEVERLLAEYEDERSRAQGRAISAGKWRAKAVRLQAELDRLSLQVSGVAEIGSRGAALHQARPG